MKNAWAARRPEKLDYKPEAPVGRHIERINPAIRSAAPHFWNEKQQQKQIEQDFQLPGWPPQTSCAGDQRPLAAARENAVDPGTQDGNDHTDGEHITNIRRTPLREFRPQQIGQRHKKHPAEQAHIPQAARVKPGLQKGKRLDAQDTARRMQHSNGNCNIPCHTQALSQEQKPYGCKNSSDTEQQP